MKKKNSDHFLKYLDLTQHQLHALTMEYNLSDAHTHQTQSTSQSKIVDRLPKLWRQAENMKQEDLNMRFVETFFRFHKQPFALKTPSLLIYSASIGLAIFSNYLKKKNLSVSLITPCFDNLHDILKHFEIHLEPLFEELLHEPDRIYTNLEENVNSDVIFIVTPNNPTGWTLNSKTGDSNKGFMEIIRFCKDNNKILAFDFCFSAFLLNDSKTQILDVYKLLEESGVSYLTLEDTGKVWPLQDAKVALIKASKDLYSDIYNIHTAYLLNVSPFILNVVTAYIENSIKDNSVSIRALLKTNRNFAEKILEGSILKFQIPLADVSVAWFKINDKTINATQLQKYILDNGDIYVLPGTYFFWNDRKLGENYIRIALARNTEMFKTAIILLREILDKYVKDKVVR